MDLSNEDTKKDWFAAWLAIGKAMKDASEKGEKPSIFKLIVDSYRAHSNIKQTLNQNILTDGTQPNTGTGTED